MKNYPPITETMPSVLPYACYYDQHTILTKNGELLQTIEISFPKKTGELDLLNQAMRKAINKVRDKNIAFWINIVRDKSAIDPGLLDKKQFYASKLIAEWNKKNNWPNKIFHSRLYLTIVIAASKNHNALSFFFFHLFDNHHKRALKKNHLILQQATESIAKAISPYQARKLSIINKGNACYSEHMQLYYRILYGHNKPSLLENADLSYAISKNTNTTIQFSHIESDAGPRQYIACFCIKSHYNMNSECIYQLTNIEQKASFTEIITFINNAKAAKDVVKQCALLKISKAANLLDALDLERISRDIDSKPEAIAYNQTIITVFADSETELKQKTDYIQQINNKLGVNIIRLDINLEQGFWSQLPANFNYITYHHPMSSRHIAQLPYIDTEISGNIYSKAWDKHYIALLTNEYNRPYFFNFHHGGIGHAIIMGDTMQRTILTNFLITHALHTKERAIILDYQQRSRIFVNAMGGKYLVVNPKPNKQNSKKIGINFLQVKDSKEARQTIKKCLEILSGQKEADWPTVIEEIMQMPKSTRTLTAIRSILLKHNIDISNWCGEGENSGIFDNAQCLNIFAESSNTTGIDLTRIIDNNTAMQALMRYILFLIDTQTNGSPTILVFSEANMMDQNNALSKNIEKWLRHMAEKNIIVIFSANYANIANTHFIKIHASLIPTRIMMPENSSYKVAKILGLEEAEERWLKTTRPLSGQFFLQQQNRKSLLWFDVRNIPSINLLYSNEKKIKTMLQLKATRTEGEKKWVKEMIGSSNE